MSKPRRQVLARARDGGDWTIVVTGHAIANAQSFALATYGLLDEEAAHTAGAPK
jgi:hypothetical protein